MFSSLALLRPENAADLVFGAEFCEEMHDIALLELSGGVRKKGLPRACNRDHLNLAGTSVS